jgi:hypothetical protein
VADQRELSLALGALLKKRVIVLVSAPDHHLGMFMACLSGKRILVADTRSGRAYPLSPALSVKPDLSEQTQAALDAVAAQCVAAGFRVTRIPTIIDKDGRTYLTYVNSLVEDDSSGATAFVPEYDGMEELNAAARKVWESLGYSVRKVNCTSVYRHFGSLHCLVNVMRRSSV